jgi:hypothetical protein
MFTARSAELAAARGSRRAQSVQGSRPSFDTQLFVHAGALLTAARADSVVLLVCFVKARPLTPYQAAALANLACSVLHCSMYSTAVPGAVGLPTAPARPVLTLACLNSACKEELLLACAVCLA